MRTGEREKRRAEAFARAIERVAAENRYPVRTFNISELDAEQRERYGFPADSTLRRRETTGSGSR